MDVHFLIDLIIFSGLFFVGIALMSPLTKKYSFPYTIALLIVGFLSQQLLHVFHIETHLVLSPDIIFFVLLPILLFEGALHINFHQFRLQFKTITALSTFGLLLSIFIVAFGLARLANIPFEVALLFGAIISSTDPIAVLALFKHLGGPKRLSLLADGESMFNDATGVVAFRVISGFVLAGQAFTSDAILAGFGSFAYIFTGSIILGLLMGYITSEVIRRIDNDPLVEAVLTAALAIGSFVVAEHFFHLSGVITTVMAAITLGHVGRTRISHKTVHFIEELWGFLGFICVSLVFFFASFNLDVSIFTDNYMAVIYAVLMVLIGRAVSVYATCFLTNNLPLFKDEPNVPLSWQHILNWGGLRGVIPLVLVYSLPESYVYREQLLAFTMGSLLFTLLFNGITIKNLLLSLKLHLPKNEEEIITYESEVFAADATLKKLDELNPQDYDKKLIVDMKKNITQSQDKLRKKLLKIGDADEVFVSLRLQSLDIQRNTVRELHNQRYINENVFYEYDLQLDMQQDALEYPEVYAEEISSAKSFRTRLKRIQSVAKSMPLFKKIAAESKDQLVEERYSLLKARIIANKEVLEYLAKCEKIFDSKKNIVQKVKMVESMYNSHQKNNKNEIGTIEKKYPRIVSSYQKKLLVASIG